MSDDDDLAKAIATGISGEDQYAIAYKAASRCWDVAKKVKGMEPSRLAFEQCKAIADWADFLSTNLEAIDRGIWPDGLPHASPKLSPAQKSSDRVYDHAYWDYYGRPGFDLGLERNRLQRAINDDGGDRQSLLTQMQALDDVIDGKPYRPPLLGG